MEHGQPPTGVDALAALPALPTPDHETRRREASHGASIGGSESRGVDGSEEGG